MIHFGSLEMDTSVWAPFFVFLTICTNRLSGLVVPSPENLRVDIWDGEATVRWSGPTNASVDFHYNVEMANYIDKWEKVDNCTGITHTYCDLSGFIHEYNMGYKVKVQLVGGQSESAWTRKKFLPNASKLRPPCFTLRPTSSSLMVHVHEKPILRKLFPYGVFYTIYLEQRADNKIDTAFLKVEDQNTTTFKSLPRGGEYCVSVRVEDKTSKTISEVSPKQCVLLPEQEWYIVAVMSLSGLAVLACTSIVAASLLCYLKRPAKTPAVLKLPVSNWFPLSVGEGTIEAVTDKGWFLSSYRPEGKNPVEFPVAGVAREVYKVAERRTSMDSGVSMEANSVEISQGNSPGRHDDSGCGSLSGSESSTSNQMEYSQRARDHKAGTGMDSKVGLANLEEQDDAVIVGNYRSQSPSAALIVVRNEEAFEPTPCHPVLAEVVSGYRAPPEVCICLGACQCSWCHKQGQKGVVGQYRATSTDNGLQRDSVPSSMTFVSYPQETQEAFLAVEDMKSAFVSLEESLPMPTALAPQHVNMNFSLSLWDVQTAAD